MSTSTPVAPDRVEAVNAFLAGEPELRAALLHKAGTPRELGITARDFRRLLRNPQISIPEPVLERISLICTAYVKDAHQLRLRSSEETFRHQQASLQEVRDVFASSRDDEAATRAAMDRMVSAISIQQKSLEAQACRIAVLNELTLFDAVTRGIRWYLADVRTIAMPAVC